MASGVPVRSRRRSGKFHNISDNCGNSLDLFELPLYPAVRISVRGYEKGVTGVEEKGYASLLLARRNCMKQSSFCIIGYGYGRF